MEIGEISLLSIVTAVAPMALFVLLALFAPLVYRRIAGKLIEKFRPHQPQWISIILDSYLSPTTILLRAVFIYAALWVLPLELNTPDIPQRIGAHHAGNRNLPDCLGRMDGCPRRAAFCCAAQKQTGYCYQPHNGAAFCKYLPSCCRRCAGIACWMHWAIPVTGPADRCWRCRYRYYPGGRSPPCQPDCRVALCWTSRLL